MQAAGGQRGPKARQILFGILAQQYVSNLVHDKLAHLATCQRRLFSVYKQKLIDFPTLAVVFMPPNISLKHSKSLNCMSYQGAT